MKIWISVFSLVTVTLLFTMCKNTESSSKAGTVAERADSVAYVGADGKLVIPEHPAMMVNDYAGVLGDSVRGLEDDLRMYAAQTPVQIAVVTITNIGDNDPLKIATEIGNRWGVGEKGKDNGVVILVQPKTAHGGGKVAIGVGKGLEPILTEVCCNGIISDTMLPKLRTGDYYGAVSAAVADLVRTISMMQQ